MSTLRNMIATVAERKYDILSSAYDLKGVSDLGIVIGAVVGMSWKSFARMGAIEELSLAYWVFSASHVYR